jgi:acyl CoA:acetate/3-ketoacid CoA transferase beta subunit
MSAERRPRRRVAVASGLFALVLGGGLFAGLGGSPSALPQHRLTILTATHVSRASKATSSQKTLPECGATRDPFDSTDSSATAC